MYPSRTTFLPWLALIVGSSGTLFACGGGDGSSGRPHASAGGASAKGGTGGTGGKSGTAGVGAGGKGIGNGGSGGAPEGGAPPEGTGGTAPSSRGGTGVSGDAGATAAGAGGIENGSGGESNGGESNGGESNGGESNGGESNGGAAALPACTAPGAVDGVALSGFRADVFSEGNVLVEPNAMVFGNDGKLYVANSHSLLTGAVDVGEILALDAAGTQTIFATGDSMRGPDGVAFGLPESAGSLGPLYVAIEDGDESGVAAADYVLSVSDGVSTPVFDAFEPNDIVRGPVAFGGDLYFTGRTPPVSAAPNPLRVFHFADGEGAQRLSDHRARGEADELVGAAVLTWGTGGALGTDLYLGTVADDPFSPTSVDAVYRVTPSGAASLLEAFSVDAIAASPAAQGPFGDFLYEIRNGTLERIDADGNVTPVMTGLARSFGLTFGPDGALYVAETAAARIIKLSACD